MADILSLSRARKARDIAARKATAAENRVRHGRSKAEKARDALVAERGVATLDNARREPDA